MTAAHCAITCLCVYKCSHNTHTHTHGAGHLGAAVQVSKSQTSSAEAGGKAGEEAKVAERGQGQRGLSGNSLSPSTPHVSKKKINQSRPLPPFPPGSICFSSPCLPDSGGFVHQPSLPPFFFSLLCLLFSKLGWISSQWPVALTDPHSLS